MVEWPILVPFRRGAIPRRLESTESGDEARPGPAQDGRVVRGRAAIDAAGRGPAGVTP